MPVPAAVGPAAAAGPRPPVVSPRAGATRWAWPAFVTAVAVTAFVLRYGVLARSGGPMSADGYDDGVYYTAADAFVHGRLPYRDFLFLHPPGILLALAPFARLGSLTADPVGVVAGRLAFITIGSANAVLVAVLARRFGLVAGLVAGAFYAVFHPAVFAERSTLLEPLGTLGVLLALLLARRVGGATRTALVLAGVAAGSAACVKIWYLVPLAVLVAFQRGGRARLVLGAAIAAALLLLPFLLAAPVPMVREVVVDQLGRPRFPQPTLLGRIDAIVGAPAVPLHGLPPHLIGVVLFLVLLALGVLVSSTRGAALYPVLAGAGIVVLLASPPYYPHYAAFVAPPLAITTGVGAGRLVAVLPPRRAVRVAVAVLLVAFVGVNVVADGRPAGRPIPAATLQRGAAQVRGCVTTDDPALLPAMNVLSRDLRAGCAVWPDVTGYTDDRDLLLARGHVVPRPRNAQWQHDVLAYLSSGSAVIVDRPTTGLDAATRMDLDRGAVLARSGHRVLRRARR